jgi:tetratricopeptide (TPR) repeat protein
MRVVASALFLLFLCGGAYGQKARPDNTPSPAIQNALGLIQKRRFSEAEGVLREYLKKAPASIDAKFLLGSLLIQTNKIDQGIMFLESVLRADPTHLQANYNLALIYSSKGDYKKAIPYLERAAGISSQNKNPTTNDIALLINLTRAYIAEKRETDGERLISLLEKTASADERVAFTLGLILAESGKYERAVPIFERLNSAHPATPDILYNLGVAYYNLDKLDDAKRVLLEAVSLSPDKPELYYRLGLVASAQKDSGNAVSYWVKAIELKPDYHEASFLVGEELLKNRKISGALPFYQKAAQLQPETVLYQLRLGVAYFRLQQYSDARKVFERLLAKYPNDVNFNYLLGYLSRAEGLYDEAVKNFEKVLKISPNNPDVLASLGYIAIERGETAKAEQILRQTVKIDPKNFPAYYDLGRLLIREKKYSEALPILEIGASLNAQDPGIHYQLFLAYSRLKQKQKAEIAFSEFKRLEKGFDAGSGSATSADKLPDLPNLDKKLNKTGSSISTDKPPSF